jgi:hypothetical protein
MSIFKELGRQGGGRQQVKKYLQCIGTTQGLMR